MIATTWTTTVLAWTLTYALHSTLLIAAALLLAKVLRHRPDVMSGVWKLALVGGIATASVHTAVGAPPLGGAIELPSTSVALAARPIPALVEPEPELVVLGPQEASALAGAVAIDAPGEVLPAGTGQELAPEPDAVSVPAVAAAPGAGPRTGPWIAAIAGLLVVGAVIGLLSVGVAVIALWRRYRERAPLRGGRLPVMLAALLRRVGSRRAIGLSVAARAHVPMATGVVRPEILLPTRVTHTLSPDQQETMLAHEVAHVLRHDPAWRLVALLVERVLFFQPLNRLASDRMAECAEYLCDEWAATHTDRPLALAQCLTEIAGWIRGPRAVATSPMAAHGSQLRARVLRLLEVSPPRRRRPWLGAAAGLVLVALVALAPGVTQGHGHRGERHRGATAVVHVEVDGEPIEVGGDAVVVHEDGGRVFVRVGDGGEASPPQAEPAPTDRKARRQGERRTAKANREAQRALRKAMRRARKEGRAAPSDEEVAAILRQARTQAGDAPSADRHTVRLMVELPDGSRIEIRGDHRQIERKLRGVERGHGRGHTRGRGRGHDHGRGRGHARDRDHDHDDDRDHARRSALEAFRRAQIEAALRQHEAARREAEAALREHEAAFREAEAALRERHAAVREAQRDAREQHELVRRELERRLRHPALRRELERQLQHPALRRQLERQLRDPALLRKLERRLSQDPPDLRRIDAPAPPSPPSPPANVMEILRGGSVPPPRSPPSPPAKPRRASPPGVTHVQWPADPGEQPR